MTRYSFLIPFLPAQPEHMRPFAGMVQSGGLYRLWTGHSMHIDSYQHFTYVAGAGFRLPVGVGVSLMPLRHPFDAAAQARSLGQVMGQPVVAGFGPGGLRFQELIMGAPYRSQLGAVREYTSIVRDLLRIGKTRRSGEFFGCHADLPPTPHGTVEIGLGVLRPGMARVTGELADVAITWLTPARYVAEVIVPALEAGAAQAGRARPRIAAMVPVGLAVDDRDPVDVALASNGVHLTLPHYQDMLRRSGIDIDPADPRGVGKNAVAGGAILFGDVAAVAAGLQEYVDAGVDEIVFNVTGVCQLEGVEAALRDVQTLLEAMA